MSFISNIEVVYGDNRPHNAVSEIHGGNADINCGFGGDYVWLKVNNATRPREFVSSISTQQHGSSMAGMSDLAKGAGGDFRYLHMARDLAQDQFVVEVGLWRTDSQQGSAPAGWSGKTADINNNRGGDFLYLVWKTKGYIGPKDY